MTPRSYCKKVINESSQKKEKKKDSTYDTRKPLVDGEGVRAEGTASKLDDDDLPKESEDPDGDENGVVL